MIKRPPLNSCESASQADGDRANVISVERCTDPSTANNGSGSAARVSLDSAQPASCRIRVAMQGAPLGEPLASPGNSGSRADPVSLSLGSPGVHSGISSLWRTVSGKVRGGELSRRPSWWSEDLEQFNAGVDARKTPRGTPVGSGSQRRSISGADDPSRTPPWSPRPSLRRMATVSSLQTLHPAASLKPPQRAPASSAPLTPSIDPWANIDSDTLEGIIADESEPLLERYRAMSMLSDRSRRSRSLGSELEHRTPCDTPMAGGEQLESSRPPLPPRQARRGAGAASTYSAPVLGPAHPSTVVEPEGPGEGAASKLSTARTRTLDRWRPGQPRRRSCPPTITVTHLLPLGLARLKATAHRQL